MQVDLRQQRRLLVDRRIVRLTRYRCVVVFHFWHKPQHGSGGEPSAVDSHGLDVRPDPFRDRGAGTVGPCDLYAGGGEEKKTKNVSQTRDETDNVEKFKIKIKFSGRSRLNFENHGFRNDALVSRRHNLVSRIKVNEYFFIRIDAGR